MPQNLTLLTLTVRDYDEAIAFYVNKLGFEMLEDTDRGGGKRWVRVRPRGAGDGGAAILLARAVGAEQLASVGNQTGGRVMMFIETDDFWRDYRALKGRGVEFVREPKVEEYGTVAVLVDLYGNRIDLIGPGEDIGRSPLLIDCCAINLSSPAGGGGGGFANESLR